VAGSDKAQQGTIQQMNHLPQQSIYMSTLKGGEALMYIDTIRTHCSMSRQERENMMMMIRK